MPRIEARVETGFGEDLLKDGATVGLSNPSSVTDDKGHFVISLYPAHIKSSKEFTLGILNCRQCFVLPNRRLMKDSKPLTFRITGDINTGAEPRDINLGVIVLK